MALICLTTILVNFSYPLTKNDIDSFNYATKVCKRTYPEAPCLKKFIKKEKLVYNAICGYKVKK